MTQRKRYLVELRVGSHRQMRETPLHSDLANIRHCNTRKPHGQGRQSTIDRDANQLANFQFTGHRSLSGEPENEGTPVASALGVIGPVPRNRSFEIPDRHQTSDKTTSSYATPRKNHRSPVAQKILFGSTIQITTNMLARHSVARIPPCRCAGSR